MAACAKAVVDAGLRARHFGRIPSPAIASFGIARRIPTLMVTGSHIPDDRNGIKFNLPSGEILKDDEAGIRRQDVSLPEGHFDGAGRLVDGVGLDTVETDAYDAYVTRYMSFFPAGCLSGVRVGLYEHSSVAREAMRDVLSGLGAEVKALGRSEAFLPVDTEAIRAEDVHLAREWARDGALDALVSADGDGDRPLVGDERGEWLRGDIAGPLCARYLGVRSLVTPVSSNTAVDRSGWFARVLRTRIGSPYVVAGMQELLATGPTPVAGYEANGGFLTGDDIVREGRVLPALPTRDAVIVVLSVLCLAREYGQRVSELARALPARYTYSDRIKDFPTELSQARLATMSTGDPQRDQAAAEAVFGVSFGPVVGLDTTDGVRITFQSGEIAHLRPSGNAPELRAYTEADSPERAAEMNRICMHVLAGWTA
jgi:phosphomannomutase